MGHALHAKSKDNGKLREISVTCFTDKNLISLVQGSYKEVKKEMNKEIDNEI
jgi:hypothetical protein